MCGTHPNPIHIVRSGVHWCVFPGAGVPIESKRWNFCLFRIFPVQTLSSFIYWVFQEHESLHVTCRGHWFHGLYLDPLIGGAHLSAKLTCCPPGEETLGSVASRLHCFLPLHSSVTAQGQWLQRVATLHQLALFLDFSFLLWTYMMIRTDPCMPWTLSPKSFLKSSSLDVWV